MHPRYLQAALLAAALTFAACAGDSITGSKLRTGQGMLAVRLTDAPLPIDSVKEVNIFVERIDARRMETDSEHVNDDLDHDSTGDDHAADSSRHAEGSEEGEHSDSTEWVTIATPNQTFNLLALRNGVTAMLGASPVDTGHFKSIRLIIDPSKSNIVLKDGTVLTTTSTPSIEFENRGRHGLLVELDHSVEVGEGTTTTLTLDLKLDQSLTLRGRTTRDGFFFRGTVFGSSNRHEH